MTQTGLYHPRDLNTWRRWQQRQNPQRRLKALLRPEAPPTMWLACRGASPTLLVAVDAATPTQRASLLRPLELLGIIDVAVLLPSKLPHLLPGKNWTWHVVHPGHPNNAHPSVLTTVRATLSIGHHLPVGAMADTWAAQLDAQRLVVQHGLLTPYAPPLPTNSHLFSFTDADAEFVSAGRSDVQSTTVGSQLLWAAGSDEAIPQSLKPPLYLGQLHGAELPRRRKAQAAEDFCRDTGATYRPHPAEKDVLSRIQHSRWGRRGIEIDRTNQSLHDHCRPVVSIFSTGVLEAAARSRPAWVCYRRPPSWLSEFWERYSMRQWGREPTPAPPRPDLEPAAVIAEHTAAYAGRN